MLIELQVRNFALIDNLSLSFSDGFTVLTGETGAGKSIVIDAVSLLLGGRAYSEMIRSGEEMAWVEGLFTIPQAVATLLETWGFLDGEEMVISREIYRNGRNKCRINGHLARIAQLAELAPYLVEILGQHDQQSLLNEESHLSLLDEFGGGSLRDLADEVADLARRYRRTSGELRRLQAAEREREQRMDLLRFQIDEIERADLRPGEEEVLRERRSQLAHAERLFAVTSQVFSVLRDGGEGPGLLDQLSKQVEELCSVTSLDSRLQPSSDLFTNALVQLEEGCRELRTYIEQCEANPEELAAVEERLSLVQRLARKYGATVSDILEYLRSAQKELAELERSAQTAADLEKEQAELFQLWQAKARQLSHRRREIASTLEKQIEAELAELNMEKCRFSVAFRSEDQTVSEQGIDQVEFLISPNPGEELKPLARIASGGEMARVMLALKSILSQAELIPTLVFDEVDSGIGGKTAQKVAIKLKALSARSQVLCVTHLPIVAAYAAEHYRIEKNEVGERTIVSMERLDRDGRISELVRMLGGDKGETITAEHAKELLRRGYAS